MTPKEARRHVLTRQITRLDGRLGALRRTSETLARWRLGSFLAAVGLSVYSCLLYTSPSPRD